MKNVKKYLTMAREALGYKRITPGNRKEVYIQATFFALDANDRSARDYLLDAHYTIKTTENKKRGRKNKSLKERIEEYEKDLPNLSAVARRQRLFKIRQKLKNKYVKEEYKKYL